MDGERRRVDKLCSIQQEIEPVLREPSMSESQILSATHQAAFDDLMMEFSSNFLDHFRFVTMNQQQHEWLRVVVCTTLFFPDYQSHLITSQPTIREEKEGNKKRNCRIESSSSSTGEGNISVRQTGSASFTEHSFDDVRDLALPSSFWPRALANEP